MEKKFFRYTITLTSKDFTWFYDQAEADTLKYAGEGFQEFKSLEAKQELYEIEFGGKYNNQFTTHEEADFFNANFKELLKKKKIDLKHTAPLLYLIFFLEPFSEQESILTNRNNDLLENAKFVLDLIKNSSTFYTQISNDKTYTKVDVDTQTHSYAKSFLVQELDRDELLNYVPDKKDKNYIVSFYYVNVYNHIFYIPKDLIFTIKWITNRNFKRFSATSSTKNLVDLKLPYHLNFYLFNYTLNSILKEQKKFNTDFYRELSEDVIDFVKMDILYDSYRKNKLGKYQVLEKVILLALIYLKNNNIFKSEAQSYSFLFDYFSLFNMFPPENYSRRSKTKSSQNKIMTRNKFIQVVKDIVKKARQ